MDALQTYHATTETETVRDDAMLIVTQMGQIKPTLVNFIQDQAFIGGGIIYADGRINIHAKHDELIVSEVVGKRQARRVVARFGFNTSWAYPGCWREHLHTLALQLRVAAMWKVV
jgi:hypothetical protein